MRSDVFGTSAVKGETWLAALKSHFIVFQLLLARRRTVPAAASRGMTPADVHACVVHVYVYGGGGYLSVTYASNHTEVAAVVSPVNLQARQKQKHVVHISRSAPSGTSNRGRTLQKHDPGGRKQQ